MIMTAIMSIRMLINVYDADYWDAIMTIRMLIDDYDVDDCDYDNVDQNVD